MNYLRLILYTLLMSFPLVIQAQQAEKQDKPRYTIIPPTDMLLTIASQPDCPMQIENATLLYDYDSKRLRYQFDLRNHGTKPITGFFLDAWFAGGAGGTIIYDWEAKGRILMPGQAATELNIDEKQLIPLSQELREKLRLQDNMRSMIVLVVRYVHFTDGSSYKGLKVSDKTSKFLGRFVDEDEEP